MSIERAAWKKTAPGMKLFYDYVPGDIVLVYVNGTASNITVWNEVSEYFCGLGFGALRYDARGNGRSDLITDPSQASLALCTQDLEVLLTKIDVGVPVVLIGHSAGGTLAMNYAALHPDSVDGLVTIASQYDVKANATDVAMRNFGAVPKSINQVQSWIDKGYPGRDGYYFDFSDPEIRKKGRDFSLTAVKSSMNLKQVKSALCYTQGVLEWKVDPAQVKARSLVVQGTEDILVKPETPYRLSEMIPDSMEPVILEGVGHEIPFMHPELAVESIGGLLRELYPQKFS